MRKVFVLIAVMIAMSASLAQAQERQLFRINVPFDFTAEDAAFPAGFYMVCLVNPYSVRVQSWDGQHVANIREFATERYSPPQTSGLLFRRIHGQFFLIAIREQDAKIREIPLGSQARELIAKDRDQQGYPSAVAISAR